jgi:hypothetical protein
MRSNVRRASRGEESPLATDTPGEQLKWGAVGAVALIAFLLGAVWIDGLVTVSVPRLFASLAHAVGVSPANPIAYGLLAFAVCALPFDLLLVAAFIWGMRTTSRVGRVTSVLLALVALALDGIAGLALVQALPHQAAQVYIAASALTFVCLLFAATLYLRTASRGLEQQAALYEAEDRAEASNKRINLTP